MKRLAKKYKSFLSDLAQFRKDLIENPSMGADPNMIANNLEPFRLTHPGEVLKDELEYRGISQKQLAAEMGISYTLLNEDWIFQQNHCCRCRQDTICLQPNGINRLWKSCRMSVRLSQHFNCLPFTENLPI